MEQADGHRGQFGPAGQLLAGQAAYGDDDGRVGAPQCLHG